MGVHGNQRVFIFLMNTLRVITIEPMCFFKEMAAYAMITTTENFKLDRFCRVRLGYSAELCAKEDDGHHEDLQIEVQKLVNLFNFYQQLAGLIIPVLLLSFIATWSDQKGRKVPILLSIFGYILYAFVYLLVSLFPSWDPEILLLACFMRSLGGGFPLFYMACYSYITDKSSLKSRAVRMFAMRALWALGAPTGTAVGAIIYDTAGYPWLFGFCFFMFVLCFIYSAIVVKDNEKVQESQELQSTSKQRKLYNPKNVSDLFKACFRRRQGNGRLHMTILLIQIFGVVSSTKHNMYLWALRVFNWNINSYSLYRTVSDLGQAISLLLITPLCRYLNLHDCMMGAIFSFLVFCQLLVFGFLTRPNQDWVLYLFVIVPNEAVSIAIRSQMSKVCGSDEIGRIFAMVAVIEVFWPVVDTAIFTAVYGATISFYPSFEHFVSAAFVGGTFCAFLILKLSFNKDEITALKRNLK